MMLIILILIGSLIVIGSILVLRKLVRKLISPEQYIQFKKYKVAWVVPLIIGCIVIIVGTTVFFQYDGSDLIPFWKMLSTWAMQHAVPLLLIILVTIILSTILTFSVPLAVNNTLKLHRNGKSTDEEIRKRSGILGKFLIRIGQWTIYLIAAFMVLSELGINITPLLAGAGIVGIAVGLGSQKIIGDLLNGAFIMLEDYYSVGDVVQIAGISGLVEEVDIRRTTLRDLDGIVHIIPNGEIKIASNYTRNWSRVNLDVPVSYNEDLDKVIAILNLVGLQLAEDEQFKEMIISPPQVLRVNNFGDSAIEIKMLGDTKPIKQWDVAGELRKRIKKAFDEEHIEIPWPHMKVYFGNSQIKTSEPDKM